MEFKFFEFVMKRSKEFNFDGVWYSPLTFDRNSITRLNAWVGTVTFVQILTYNLTVLEYVACSFNCYSQVFTKMSRICKFFEIFINYVDFSWESETHSLRIKFIEFFLFHAFLKKLQGNFKSKKIISRFFTEFWI